MKVKPDESLAKWLRVYELPEDQAIHQPYINRAEEDLLCAIALYRQGACGYLPSNNVCYLLHQAIEKWLKALLEVRGIAYAAPGQHDLFSRLTIVADLDPMFLGIRDRIEKVDGKLMAHSFPGGLRYGETPPEIDGYIRVLLEAAFATRRLVKRHLKKKEGG